MQYLFESRARAMYAKHVGKQATDAVRNGEKYRVTPWAKLAPTTQGQWRAQAEAEHMAEVMASRRKPDPYAVRRGDPGVVFGHTMAGPFASVAELRQELADARNRERDAYHRGVTDADARANRQAGELAALRHKLAEMTRWRDNALAQRDEAREAERAGQREREDLRRGIMRGQNVITMEAHRHALAFAERARDAARHQRMEAVEQRNNACEQAERLREELTKAERGWESAGRENRASRGELAELRAELAETRDIAAKAQREREEARDKHVECYRQLTHTRELLAEAVATASRPLPACKGHNDSEYRRGLAAARAAVKAERDAAPTRDVTDYAQGRRTGLEFALERIDRLGANHV